MDDRIDPNNPSQLILLRKPMRGWGGDGGLLQSWDGFLEPVYQQALAIESRDAIFRLFPSVDLESNTKECRLKRNMLRIFYVSIRSSSRSKRGISYQPSSGRRSLTILKSVICELDCCSISAVSADWNGESLSFDFFVFLFFFDLFRVIRG